ncbi:MAG: DapH/DapD/GlmU-related protein [Thermoanaerobaculia bacterium]|nr:DapH/DapD/GlmU-related protein [Thermoanaerobaculia bacterium]
MLDNLRADTRRLREFKTKSFPWYVLESLFFENGYQAILLYRIASAFKRWGVPILGPLFARLSLFLTGVDIAPGARIGPGLLVAHGTGLVIGDRVVIGRDAILLHQVTIGASGRDTRDAMPVIGDRVFVGAGARLIGGIRVGDDVFVGTNAVVTRDLPDGAKLILKQQFREPRSPSSRSNRR